MRKILFLTKYGISVKTGYVPEIEIRGEMKRFEKIPVSCQSLNNKMKNDDNAKLPFTYFNLRVRFYVYKYLLFY